MKFNIITAARLIASLTMLALLYKKSVGSDDGVDTTTATAAVYVLAFGVAGLSGAAMLLFFNAIGVLIIMTVLTLIVSAAIVISMAEDDEDGTTALESTRPEVSVEIDRID